jgi:hypothetical protein
MEIWTEREKEVLKAILLYPDLASEALNKFEKLNGSVNEELHNFAALVCGHLNENPEDPGAALLEVGVERNSVIAKIAGVIFRQTVKEDHSGDVVKRWTCEQVIKDFKPIGRRKKKKKEK